MGLFRLHGSRLAIVSVSFLYAMLRSPSRCCRQGESSPPFPAIKERNAFPQMSNLGINELVDLSLTVCTYLLCACFELSRTFSSHRNNLLKR